MQLRRTVILAAALTMAAVGIGAGTAGAGTGLGTPGGGPIQGPDVKVWVCKYVGQPGVSEVLKPGKNPISVSINSTEFVGLGFFFKDGQFRSIAIAVDTGQDPATLPPCPAPEPPPPPPPPPNPVQYTITQNGDGHCDTQGFGQIRFAIRPKTFPQPFISLTGTNVAQQGFVTGEPNAWIVHAITLGGAGNIFSGTVTINVDGTNYVVPFVIENRALCPTPA